MSDIEGTAKELGALLGISERKVRDLAAEGHVVRTDRGRYLIPESVRKYCEHLRMVAGGRGGADAALDLSRERARLASEQADAQALKNAALRRELVRADDVARVWADMLRGVRSGLLATPSRLRQTLPHLTPRDVGAIDAELRRTLETLGADK